MTPPCKLYLTHRSEYLVLGDLCVGVRDRERGVWIPLHAATCAHVLGPTADPLCDDPRKPSMQATMPRVGEHLALYAVARRITTGTIVAIERASPALVEDADRRWHELFDRSDRRRSVITVA